MRRTMADIFAQLFLVAVLCGVVTSRGLFDYDDERKEPQNVLALLYKDFSCCRCLFHHLQRVNRACYAVVVMSVCPFV